MSVYGVDYPPAYDPGPEDNPTVVDPRRSWRPVDLSPVLGGQYKPAEATVGRRADGRGMFYPGKQHTVSSESEAGKTWLVLSAAQDEMRDGNHVVYLDFEDDSGPIIDRLKAIGVPAELITSNFHYIRPEEPLTRDHLWDLGEAMHTKPTLAVIDGVTEAMTLHGMDPNSNTDCAHFGRMLPRRLAELGAATVSLDHVTKAADTRGRYSIGGQHKLSGLNGAAYVMTARTPFGVGVTGKSYIRIAKDRPGQLRQYAIPGNPEYPMAWFGTLVLTSHAKEFAEVEVEVPFVEEGNWRPTHIMEALSRAIAAHGAPISQREALMLVNGKQATKAAAFAYLKADGYITSTTPHTSLRPFVAGGAG